MRPQPRLSKSRYVVGLQCPRRLWLGWHDPEPRSEPEPGSILAVGTDVGIAARLLVFGGVLIEEGPQQHRAAVEAHPTANSQSGDKIRRQERHAGQRARRDEGCALALEA